MPTYLIVANQTLGGKELLDKVTELAAAGPCDFYLVVPATRAEGTPHLDRGRGAYDRRSPARRGSRPFAWRRRRPSTVRLATPARSSPSTTPCAIAPSIT